MLINPSSTFGFIQNTFPEEGWKTASVLRLLAWKQHQNLQLRSGPTVKKNKDISQTDRNITKAIRFSCEKPTNNTGIGSCTVPKTGCMRMTCSALCSFTYFCVRANHKAIVIKSEELLFPENRGAGGEGCDLNFLGGVLWLKKSPNLEIEETCKVTPSPDCSHHVLPNHLCNTATYWQVKKLSTKIKLAESP